MVRYILVSDIQIAQNAYERLRRGESFERVAKGISQGTGSVANVGLIKLLRGGALVPEFGNMVVSLKDNEMSGVVESPYGYHSNA
jgi:parvulin-like peptidyl-prolyl isomerase